MIMKNVSLLVGMDKSTRGIGYNNELVWHCANDMQWFKSFTTNKSVVMGRKTFQSLNLPFGLPNRINYVLTNDIHKHKSTDKVRYVTLDLMLKYFRNYEDMEEFVIIGGEEIYNLFMPHVSVAYVSEIDESLIRDLQPFDSFFPKLPEDFTLSSTNNQKYCSIKKYTRDDT